MTKLKANSNKQRRTGRSHMAFAAAAFGLTALASNVQAQMVYNIAGLADFTGPYADIMKDLTSCRRAVIDWWNEEVGKGAGITLRIKDYDHRYDVAQVVSLWPGVKSELNPVLALGIGGVDAAGLQERLPADKIPMILSTASYGYAWKANPWVFNPRATYVHEGAAFMEWYRKKRGGDAPLKIGIISSEATPAYIDINRGMEKYAKDNPKSVEVVEVVFTEVQPTDLTTQVNRMVRKGVEVIQIQTNTAAVVAVRRALQALGKSNIPVMVSAHNSLPASGKAIGGLASMEGSYEVYGMAIPTEDDTTARQFYERLRSKYKLTAAFSVPCVMGLNETLVGVRAIEAAAKDAGAAKIDGAAVRNALISKPISSAQTFGVLPNLQYSDEAPFPTAGLGVNIGTVKNGKYTIVEQGVPVPAVNKW